MPVTKTQPYKDRNQVGVTAAGLIVENGPRQLFTGTQIMTDGVAYFMKIGLRAGDVVTNIVIGITTAGTATTLSKAGLYTKAGVQLAASADQGSAWNSTGIKSVAMGTPYTVPADDGYYVCVVSKATTTLATLLRGANNSLATAAVGTGMAEIGTQTAQTDLPSPATITFGSGSPQGFWVGIS